MQVKAKLRYLRMSPKKVRLIANLIKVLKLLNSAVANAEHSYNLKKENLFIKEIKVDMAGALKRWQPKAHGRATLLLKKISHISLILEEIVPSKVKAAKVKKAKKEEIKPIKLSSLKEVKERMKAEKIPLKSEAKPVGHEKEINKEIHDVREEGKHRHKQNEEKRQMKGKRGFIKKLFSRKAG